MQETKVTLIYWGLSLFIFLSLAPWIFDFVIGIISIQTLGIYGGIIIAFLGGMIWGWGPESFSSKNLWHAIGFSILGLVVSLTSAAASFDFIFSPTSYLTVSLILLTISFQLFLYFEKKNSNFFQENKKYSNARTLITNLVTICCITSLAWLYNPYS
ncbi:MAG: hypothetical protein CMD68_01325 [Gammaproteobacteria bacterium]|nr:hypothetical protein [Gammaproteobacteria bacterium]|tara:strand:+ start:69 stop:539 length:471 start_codon:yes stop_codon:yes gene_type:complete